MNIKAIMNNNNISSTTFKLLIITRDKGKPIGAIHSLKRDTKNSCKFILIL